MEAERQSRISVVRKLPKVSSFRQVETPFAMRCTRCRSEASCMWHCLRKAAGFWTRSDTVASAFACPPSLSSASHAGVFCTQVNAAAAARLLSKKGAAALARPAADSDDEEPEADVPADGQPSAKRQRRAAANPLTDDRFVSMFRDRNFEIDMESDEYKLLHPNAGVVSPGSSCRPLSAWVQLQNLACLQSDSDVGSCWCKLCNSTAGMIAGGQAAVHHLSYSCACAEGRAKDKQLLREHFRQLPDVDEEPGAEDEVEDAGTEDGDGYDLQGGPSDDDDDDDQVRGHVACCAIRRGARLGLGIKPHAREGQTATFAGMRSSC